MTSWRDLLEVHPAAQLFPLMGPDELRELGEDIKKHGLRSPIWFFTAKDGQEPSVLDGRNRLDAMEIVGYRFEPGPPGGHSLHVIKPDGAAHIEWEWRRYANGSDEPYAFVASANIHRRHLSAQQKRELIESLLRERPERSDRATAAIAKTSKNTVAAVREDLEARGQIDHVETRVDTKGRSQPAKKPPVHHPGPATPPDSKNELYQAEPTAAVPPAREPSKQDIEARRRWGLIEARATSGLYQYDTAGRRRLATPETVSDAPQLTTPKAATSKPTVISYVPHREDAAPATPATAPKSSVVEMLDNALLQLSDDFHIWVRCIGTDAQKELAAKLRQIAEVANGLADVAEKVAAEGRDNSDDESAA